LYSKKQIKIPLRSPFAKGGNKIPSCSPRRHVGGEKKGGFRILIIEIFLYFFRDIILNYLYFVQGQKLTNSEKALDKKSMSPK